MVKQLLIVNEFDV